jgi:hypothetical protein
VYYLWTADCGKFDLNAKEHNKLVCTLRRDECKPGSCKFDIKSDDEPPLSLVFGISRYNPECGWVWDKYKKVYVYKAC